MAIAEFSDKLPNWHRIGWLALLALAGSANAAGSHPDSLTLVRQDGRSLAALAYLPEGDSCRGIAVISHGAGGSENGYRYLAEALAADGFVAVVPGHQESGLQALSTDILKKGLNAGLIALLTNPAAYQGRLQDIAAARAWAAQHCSGQNSVLLGHSMGAAVTMIEAGADNKLAIQGGDHFDAYVALSPQGVGDIFPGHAWQHIQKPMLSLTGTRDREVGGRQWQARTEAYADLAPGCKWLAVIDGASHMNFAGNALNEAKKQLILGTIRSFLNGVASGQCQLPARQPGLALSAK